MLSDDSDLTELSYEENAVQATKAKESKKKMGYRLRNVLKPGRTTQYTAKALYDQIHDNDINLDPEYQRDVVWSEAKQIGLIDSIFRNFYVPPIIFAVTTEDDGTEKRVCIDGKQRLTSIQKFIGGLIPHRDAFTNEKLWFIDSTTGPKRRLLPPQYKTLFQNKQIVCIEYSELPPDLEREVFQRVQMGMALTTAEKMQAISGPWPDLVREITNEYHLGVDGISENMDLNHARARDFQNLAQLIYCVDQLPGQVQGTTMQVEKWLSREDGPSEGFRKRIHDVFKTFRDIARDKQLKAPLKKPSRVAPAEFIMIGILIAMFKDRFSLPQLSQAIGTLRTETRAVHADVRANAKVFKTMFQLLSKQIPDSPQVETSGRPIAGSSSGTPTVRNNSGLGKRKRHESSEDDDDISPKLQDSHDPPQHRVPKSPSARLSLAINGPSKAKAEDNKSVCAFCVLSFEDY
ncbi:hypothetical protein JB92DRAFT_3310266 [Gautieria morchelliformis]|nr:hypothetical protein JB92DRAFT_3310266 [Gautieria morchelliformis]